MLVFSRVLLLIAGILLVNLQLAIRQGEFAVPVCVDLEGFDAAELATARLRAVYIGHDDMVKPTRPGHWECPPRGTVNVFLRFAEKPASGGTVRIAIGTEVFTLDLGELESNGSECWLPDRVALPNPPGFAMCRNWPGAGAFLRYYCTRSAPGLAAVLLLVVGVAYGTRGPLRRRFQWAFGLADTREAATTRVSEASWRAWNLVGWTALVAGFLGLELQEPYYFAQDDALAGELPGILLGCRSLWEGTFPDWNPYVLLGAPLATIGFWAVTYPPQLISYAIARHLLGNEFATLEVFAALHLLAGFIAMRHLCRRVGMGAMSANVASLSFVFAGCILIMGRSWQPFIANAVWLPLLGLAIVRFREGPVGWKWVLGVGVVLGLAYHAGFPQIVAILGMFLVVGLASVALGDRLSLRRVAPVAPALLLGIGLSAPLLLHHLHFTSGLERFAPAEDGDYHELHGALLPYPLAQTEFATPWGSFHVEKMGHFYFFGGLFALLFAVQAVAFWLCFPERSAWARYWWVPCGIFAMLMVLGEPAFLWQGVAALPMSKFFLRYTVRFYPWLAFCAVLSGGVILERVLATLRGRRPWELLVGGVMLFVLAYHLAMCGPSFYSYGFRPYPPLPAEFESVFHPYEDRSFIGDKNSRRLASWSQLRSPDPEFYASLPLNLPHCYQVPSIFGYDPVVEGQPRMTEVYRRLQEAPLEACKAYGVGWHLFGYPDAPVLSPNERMFFVESAVVFEPVYRRLLTAQFTTLAQWHGVTLKELPGTLPLAFTSDQPMGALPLRLHCRGADLDVGNLPAGTAVTINFLWYPEMHLWFDGEPLPVEKDDWQRITTTLPRTGSALALRYQPPWQRTCALAVIVCAAALSLGWVAMRFREAP
jgi:hypothetical protein